MKLDEVRQHLDETWFAWIGGPGRTASTTTNDYGQHLPRQRYPGHPH